MIISLIMMTFNSASSVEYVLNNDKEVVAFYAVLERKPGAIHLER